MMTNSELKAVYPHLADLALEVMESSDQARIEFLKHDAKDGIWLSYPAADAFVDECLDLFHATKEHRPDHRPECRFLVANTNCGKTMVLGRFRALANGSPSHDADGVTFPIVYIIAPGSPSEGGLHEQILTAIGAPFNAGSKAVSKGNIVKSQLAAAGTRMILIDEAEHLASGDSRNLARCLHAIKDLSSSLKIPVVIAGGIEAIQPMTSLSPVENRFMPFVLNRWTLGPDFMALLNSFASILPLRKQSKLDQHAIAKEIITRSNGAIGEISALLRQAGILAIKTGKEMIDLELIRESAYSGPMARRQMLTEFMATEQTYASKR
jgi:hypothetical protein